MSQDIDAQIRELQTRKKEQNKSVAKANLVKVVGAKGSTTEQLLEVCYSFIGTHRLNGTRKPKVIEPSQ